MPAGAVGIQMPASERMGICSDSKAVLADCHTLWHVSPIATPCRMSRRLPRPVACLADDEALAGCMADDQALAGCLDDDQALAGCLADDQALAGCLAACPSHDWVPYSGGRVCVP